MVSLAETLDRRRIVNVFLRSTTLAIRFVFFMILAKYLEPEMVGYYGLFTATVGYVIYFVGMDFYIFATREVLRTSADKRGPLIKGQAFLSFGLYLLFLPLALGFISQAGWPDFLFFWFAPILILEHLNQELSRLLIALSHQVTASLVLFLRQGSWAIATLILFFSTPESRTLPLVLALWSLGGLAAAALGCWRIRSLDIGGWRSSVDWKWVRRGVALSFGFLISTLALRAIQTLDRYWIDALGGVEVVAAYVLFMGVAGTLLAFLDAAVFSFVYPDLIRFGHEGNQAKAQLLLRRALLQTVFLSLVFAAISWGALPFLLGWIDNPVYKDRVGLYPLILSATVLSAISMIPHYALYARNFDRPIILSHIVGLCVFVAATWLMSRNGSVVAVPIGLNFAFLSILLIKGAAYLHLLTPNVGTIQNRTPS